MDIPLNSYLFRFTTLCNEKCNFCNVTKVTDKKFVEKSLKEALLEIKEVIVQNGGTEDLEIVISGGEPTVRKDLKKFVLGIKKLGIKYIKLQTNAILLDFELANFLSNNNVSDFFISFHYHQKELFEKYVGVTGIFDLVVNNIKNLGSLTNVEITLNIVISKVNYKGLKEYFDFIKKNFPFVKCISLSFIQPHGKALDDLSIMLDYETANVEFDGLLDYAFSLGFIVHNPYCGVPVCVMGWEKYLDHCMDIEEYIENQEYGIEKEVDIDKSYDNDKCGKCKYLGKCAGIWNEYIKMYGTKGIKTIL